MLAHISRTRMMYVFTRSFPCPYLYLCVSTRVYIHAFLTRLLSVFVYAYVCCVYTCIIICVSLYMCRSVLLLLTT